MHFFYSFNRTAKIFIQKIYSLKKTRKLFIQRIYSFKKSKIINSKISFIQKKSKIIHSKNLFIQENPKLFIQEKYSFKWKMGYRPWLHLPLSLEAKVGKSNPPSRHSGQGLQVAKAGDEFKLFRSFGLSKETTLSKERLLEENKLLWLPTCSSQYLRASIQISNPALSAEKRNQPRSPLSIQPIGQPSSAGLVVVVVDQG